MIESGGETAIKPGPVDFASSLPGRVLGSGTTGLVFSRVEAHVRGRLQLC